MGDQTNNAMEDSFSLLVLYAHASHAKTSVLESLT